MNQVESVGGFSRARKTWPVKSAFATSLTGMTLRMVQNSTTSTTPERRKIESLVNETRVSETGLCRKHRLSPYQSIMTGNETGRPVHSHSLRTAIGRKRIVYATYAQTWVFYMAAWRGPDHILGAGSSVWQFGVRASQHVDVLSNLIHPSRAAGSAHANR